MQMQTRIEKKLMDGLSPVEFLSVVNESHQHAVRPGAESHFNVVVVSERFTDQRLLARHRLIYALLTAELAEGVHALALHAYTPSEWQQQPQVEASPACSKKKG